VISELQRQPPHPAVAGWFASTIEEEVFLSVVSIAEIRQGIELLETGRRKRVFRQWLDVEVPARFGERILPVTSDIAHAWGKLMSGARRRGLGLATMDAFLAATANHHGLTLVSRDADLVPFCDSLLNPFQH